MNSSLYFHTDQQKSDKADLLDPFKSVFFQFFEQLVDSCCIRIDLEFGLHYGKEREQINKEYPKNLLEYIRSVRADIKRSYLSKINENFNPVDRQKGAPSTDQINMPAIALASDDLIRENYISTLIIRQCDQMYREELVRLNRLIAVLLKKTAIADRQNPIAPENLIKPFLEVIKSLKLNSSQRVSIYKVFDANVFSQMGFIYRELIKHSESSIAKLKIEQENFDGRVKSAAAPSETSIAEFHQLQAKLALWRSAQTPSGYDPVPASGNNFYEHFEIKNALQILGKFSTHATIPPEMEKHPLKWRVSKTLEELNFSDETKALAKSDEDVLDLVSLIFAGIADNPYLSDYVRTTILPLQIPMTAVCLDQYNVFINPLNPIRRLLDDLVAAGQLLNSNNGTDALVLERINKITNKLLTDNGFNLSCWAEAGKEFSQFTLTQHQISRANEDSSIQSMIARETISPERRAVADLLEKSMQNKNLPPTVIDFLQNVWHDVILDSCLVKDRQPELREKSIQTMAELIASVNPPANDSERNQILKSIPGMIKELRNGLKRIAYDKEAQNRFFKELAVLHIILMDKKLARKSIINENLLFIARNGEKILQIEAKGLAELFRQGRATPTRFTGLPITESVLSKLMDFNPPAHQ